MFPVQEWAISWIATEVPDLSPVIILGEAKAIIIIKYIYDY